MNVSAIHAVYAPYGPRRWSRPVDRSLDGDRVEVRTGFDGDAYIPSSVESPVEPPWRVLPWPRPASAARCHCPTAVNPAAARADVNAIGRTLDLFV